MNKMVMDKMKLKMGKVDRKKLEMVMDKIEMGDTVSIYRPFCTV